MCSLWKPFFKTRYLKLATLSSGVFWFENLANEKKLEISQIRTEVPGSHSLGCLFTKVYFFAG